jgi:hypothetical protein
VHELIRIQIDGEQVEGRIRHLTRNNICVGITFPFAAVSEGSHIPYFALPWFRFEESGALSAYGRQAAERILREIYGACSFCEANEGSLLAECWRIRKQGKWFLLSQWLRATDWRENWFWAPLLVFIGCFLTDWALLNQCQDAIESRTGRKLPEDLVRRLLSLVDWGERNRTTIESYCC